MAYSASVDPNARPSESQQCSSSEHSTRFSPPVGIDKLAIWYPTTPTGWFTRAVPHHGTTLCIKAKRTGAGFEFNPSRIIDPFGTGLATMEQTALLTEGVWSVVTQHAAPTVDLLSAQVTRIDLARDFYGSMEPAQLILGLSRVQRSYQGDPALRINGKTGELQSLRVGSDENLVRLYRKDQESGGLDGTSCIRWECQVRSRPLKRFGISTFADLTPEIITELAEYRWAWSQMGTPVFTGRGSLDLWSGPNSPDPMNGRIYLDLDRLARSGVWPTTNYSRKRLRDFIRAHGIVVTDGVFVSESDSPLVERLDWATATVVSTLNPDETDGALT